MKNCSYFRWIKTKIVIYGKDSAQKRLWRSRTCQKWYWVPNSHNYFIQVALGCYIVTFKMMLD